MGSDVSWHSAWTREEPGLSLHLQHWHVLTLPIEEQSSGRGVSVEQRWEPAGPWLSLFERLLVVEKGGKYVGPEVLL